MHTTMRKNNLFIIQFAVCLMCLSHFIGCSVKDSPNTNGMDEINGAPRLVVRGSVNNTEGSALSGIYVAIYGVRDEKEKDILTYNYAVTGTDGRYEIIRYRGRELPTEVTIVATDSCGIYEEQWLFAPVRYDSVYTNHRNKEPFNGIVTADFTLQKK